MKRAATNAYAIALTAAVLLCGAPAPAANEMVLYSFQGLEGAQPYAGLIDVDGTFYGTTTEGGAPCAQNNTGCGSVFSFNPKTGVYTVVYSFGAGGRFDGAVPEAGLTKVDGLLYGTTYQGGLSGIGTIFAIDPKTGAETFLYSFGAVDNDGYFPRSGLLNVNGTLYGTAFGGGLTKCGTVFEFHPNTGVERTVFSFRNNLRDACNPAAGVIAVNGLLYGTTLNGKDFYSTVYSVDPKTRAEKTIFQDSGAEPGFELTTPLVELNGLLYGASQAGGANGLGAVFSVDPATGKHAIVYSFCSRKKCTDGDRAYSGLIVVNGLLYGATGDGGGTDCFGGSGCGVVFSLDPATGVETVLHRFMGPPYDGAGTEAAPLLFAEGRLFGATAAGGSLNCPQVGCGTLFSIKP